MDDLRKQNLIKFQNSDKTHEEMLKKYIEYYRLWDLWALRRSVRTYFAAQKASKQLSRLMKKHNKEFAKDFYTFKQPNYNKKKNKPDN